MKSSVSAVLMMFTVAVLLSGCASTSESSASSMEKAQAAVSQQTQDVVIPKYTGEKTRVAVLPIAISKKALQDFPQYTAELTKQSVGFSLWNSITDALYDTGRFSFVEVSEEIVKNILDQWWLAQSGMTDPATALQMGKLKQAENFIYGEITEFGVEKSEQVAVLSSSSRMVYRVGVHIRYVNGETLEYVPATGIGRGDTIDKANTAAVRNAVIKLTERLGQ